jgi:hypothetical protein
MAERLCITPDARKRSNSKVLGPSKGNGINKHKQRNQHTQEPSCFPLEAWFKIAALSRGCSGPFFPFPWFLPLPPGPTPLATFSFIAISIAFFAFLNSFTRRLPKDPCRLLSEAERRRGSWMTALKVSKTFWIDVWWRSAIAAKGKFSWHVSAMSTILHER